MRIEVIRTALKIAEYGNLTRAAHELFLEQVSASQQLKALEEELGFALFDRVRTGSRRMIVTKRGRWWLDHASRALSVLEKGSQPDKRTLRRAGEITKSRKGDAL